MPPIDRLNNPLPDSPFLGAVRTVALTAITLHGEQTISGISVQEGDRVLVAAQGGSFPASHVNNGVWICRRGAWTRAKDFQSPRTVGSGAYVTWYGADNAVLNWQIRFTGVFAPGVTPIAVANLGTGIVGPQGPQGVPGVPGATSLGALLAAQSDKDVARSSAPNAFLYGFKGVTSAEWAALQAAGEKFDEVDIASMDDAQFASWQARPKPMTLAQVAAVNDAAWVKFRTAAARWFAVTGMVSTLVLPAQTFAKQAEWVGASNIHVTCESKYSASIKQVAAPTAGTDMFYFSEKDNFVFSKVILDGNAVLTANDGRYASGASTTRGVVHFSVCSNWKMQHCKVIGWNAPGSAANLNSVGIFANVAIGYEITNCDIEGMVGRSFYNSGIMIASASAIIGGVDYRTRDGLIAYNNVTKGNVSIFSLHCRVLFNRITKYGFSAGVNTQFNIPGTPESSANNVIIGNYIGETLTVMGSDPSGPENAYAPAAIENWARRSFVAFNVCVKACGSGIDAGGADSIYAYNVVEDNGTGEFGSGGIMIHHHDDDNTVNGSQFTGNIIRNSPGNASQKCAYLFKDVAASYFKNIKFGPNQMSNHPLGNYRKGTVSGLPFPVDPGVIGLSWSTEQGVAAGNGVGAGYVEAIGGEGASGGGRFSIKTKHPVTGAETFRAQFGVRSAIKGGADNDDILIKSEANGPITIEASNLRPENPNTDLGDSNHRWGRVYANAMDRGQGYADGALHCGEWFNPGGATTAFQVTEDTLLFMPLKLSAAKTWPKACISVASAAAAGQKARLGLYDMQAGKAASRLFDWVEVPIDVTGLQEGVIPGSWQSVAGFYTLAVFLPNGANIYGFSQGNVYNDYTSIMGASNRGTFDARTIVTGVSYGALPATVTPTRDNGIIPAIMLKA